VFELLTTQQDISEAEIARELDKSREAVNQSVKKIRKVVRQVLDREENPSTEVRTLAGMRKKYIQMRPEQGTSVQTIAGELDISYKRVNQIKKNLEACAV
jgi:biotin operon repressor